ncbi:UNVERIFIED_CONTAM: hypothetical protein HDU68_010993, partial [Siphonaria sp. JEL0065]
AGKQLVERLQQSAALDLNSLYCRALFKAYPANELVVDFKNCVGVILLARVPLSTEAIYELLQHLTNETNLTKLQVNKTFRLLQSLLKTNKDNKLSFIHKTVPDYLYSIGCHTGSLGKDDCESTYSNHCCHNQASTRFQIDFDRVSLDMALGCLADMNQKLT